MPRIDLVVSFSENEEVKRRGGRWDPVARVWYIPEGVDPGPFTPWIPVPPPINVRSSSYFFASSVHPCPHCQRVTTVHGFLLPAGHCVLQSDDFVEDEWEVADEPTLLSDIEYLSPSVARRIDELAPNYCLGMTLSSKVSTWLNYCEHCASPLEDNEIFDEPGMGFLAFTEEDARRVALLTINEEFGALCGSFSMGVSLFEEMAVF
jgi:hypothetical protein